MSGEVRRVLDGRVLRGALLVGGLGYLGWIAGRVLSGSADFVVDDTFITLRYASHLGSGYGLRFNTSDPAPVEGFSSLLHVLLLATASGRQDLLVAARQLAWLAFLLQPLILGLAFARATGVAWDRGLGVGIALQLGLLWLPDTRLHLASGMETPVFMACVAGVAGWTLCALERERSSRAGLVAAGAIVLGLATLARPEGGALALASLGTLFLVRAREDGLRGALDAPVLVRTGALFLLGLGLYWLWKQAVFGHWLPNAYYVKSDNRIFGSRGALLPGLAETWSFVRLYGPAALGAALLALAASRFRAAGWRALAATLPGLAIVALYTRAIHEQAFGHRYEFPYLVYVQLLLGFALCTAFSRSLARVAPLLLLAAVAGTQLGPAASLPRSATGWRSFGLYDVSFAHEWLGRDLARTRLGERATILLSGAGAVPFFSRFRCIDWVGLNDDRLSGREALSLDQVWDYLESFQPDVVYSVFPPASTGIDTAGRDPAFRSEPVRRVLAGYGSKLFKYWDRARLAEMVHREMLFVRDHYEFGAAYPTGQGFWLIAYVRRDSPHREVILEALRSSRHSDLSTDLRPLYVNDPRRL